MQAFISLRHRGRRSGRQICADERWKPRQFHFALVHRKHDEHAQRAYFDKLSSPTHSDLDVCIVAHINEAQNRCNHNLQAPLVLAAIPQIHLKYEIKIVMLRSRATSLTLHHHIAWQVTCLCQALMETLSQTANNCSLTTVVTPSPMTCINNCTLFTITSSF